MALGRMDLRGMQRCAFGHGAASSEIHVRHVHRNRAVLYLVRQRHFLAHSTLKPCTRPHTAAIMILHLIKRAYRGKFGRHLRTALAGGCIGYWRFLIRIMLDP